MTSKIYRSDFETRRVYGHVEYLVGPWVVLAPWGQCLGFHGVNTDILNIKKKTYKDSIALIDVGRTLGYIMDPQDQCPHLHGVLLMSKRKKKNNKRL